jgi:hypothetical protein
MIKIGPLADFTIDVLNKYSDEEKLHNANEVADLVVFLLRQRNLLTDGVQQSLVDLLLSSCMLYNIIEVTEDNWNDVYQIRNIVMEEAKGHQLPLQALETICDTIEGQLGEKMPIKGSRPNPNTPGELFALAVAIINKYNK